MYYTKEKIISHNKLIFLDIDGCVTSVNDGTFFNPDPEKYHPSKNIVNKLKNFCDINDVKIIISSNWRKFDVDGSWTNSYGTYKNPLPELIELLGEYCVGILPPDRHITKSQALIKWINEQSYTGNFVIFDDDLREGYQKTNEFDIKYRFVFVSSKYGIIDDDLDKAKDILKGIY